MATDNERVTFKQRYNASLTWQEKCILISLYHQIMCIKYPNWIIADTANHFKLSSGLVSENIRLANEINEGNTNVSESKSRDDALKLIERRSHKRIRITQVMFKLKE